MLGVISFLLVVANANPYWDQSKIAKDPIWPKFRPSKYFPVKKHFQAIEVMRVQFDWIEAKDSFELVSTVKEKSGTAAWQARVMKSNNLGSYRAYLRDAKGKLLGFDSIGTGQAYRRLTRALTFRLPIPAAAAILELVGENPKTGKMEILFKEEIPAPTQELKAQPTLEVRQLLAAKKSPALKINFYAEGYENSERESFWQAAQKAIETLKLAKFPNFEALEFHGVFAESNQPLGSATDLGMPIPERDSFLGLYFPYWQKFGRWYNVVYPTREARYRDAIGQIPYDYAIALVNDGAYWGVGNFNELTAVPAKSGQFRYLLLHEFGHFFGLNEEYEGGGPTELEFAPGISEPWSQNITFLEDYKNLKWKNHVDAKIPLPTPGDIWEREPPVYGAYKGGYADSEPRHHSHKPGFSCMMESGPNFCAICRQAIEEKINWDLGH